MNTKKYNIHTPRKDLGQHFLIDKNIINKIIHACQLNKEEAALEIGPGLGALTAKIACAVKHFHAVEKDRELYALLQENHTAPNTTFHCKDFLTFDFSRLSQSVKIIGNLPYNISSPIIEKIIQNRKKISDIFIMVQLEFGKRLAAEAGTKDYSALSCATRYCADSTILFKIKNTCFAPPPKVESCFVHMKLKPAPEKQAQDEELLFKLIKAAFQQRRKQLQNSLAAFLPKDEIKQIFETLSLNPQARAENLSIDDFVAIANALTQIKKGGIR